VVLRSCLNCIFEFSKLSIKGEFISHRFQHMYTVFKIVLCKVRYNSINKSGDLRSLFYCNKKYCMFIYRETAFHPHARLVTEQCRFLCTLTAVPPCYTCLSITESKQTTPKHLLRHEHYRPDRMPYLCWNRYKLVGRYTHLNDEAETIRRP
jgi:hypothetical protein